MCAITSRCAHESGSVVLIYTHRARTLVYDNEKSDASQVFLLDPPVLMHFHEVMQRYRETGPVNSLAFISVHIPPQQNMRAVNTRIKFKCSIFGSRAPLMR